MTSFLVFGSFEEGFGILSCACSLPRSCSSDRMAGGRSWFRMLVPSKNTAEYRRSQHPDSSYCSRWIAALSQVYPVLSVSLLRGQPRTRSGYIACRCSLLQPWRTVSHSGWRASVLASQLPIELVWACNSQRQARSPEAWPSICRMQSLEHSSCWRGRSCCWGCEGCCSTGVLPPFQDSHLETWKR
jgi:hypothetical protein